MESGMREFGELIGFALNIWVQFFIWRYVIVYVVEKGDKRGYEQNRAVHVFASIVPSVFGYIILRSITQTDVGVGMFLILCMLGVSLFCAIQWRTHPITLRNSHLPSTTNPIASKHAKADTSVVTVKSPRASIVTEAHCSSCGKPVLKDAKYCHHCGLEFGGDMPTKTAESTSD